MAPRFQRLALAAAVSASLGLAAMGSDGFIGVDGRHFVRDGRAWYVCGANLWYGANLGRPSNPAGRARLVRELDRLEKLGVNNLRVLGASEQSSVPKTVRPAIQTSPGVYNEDVLAGLDFLAREAGRRHMTLVIFLNNFWDWSGGVPQYLSWTTGKPAQGVDYAPWKDWNRLQSTFYTDAAAQDLYRRYVAMILGRTNSLTGVRYRDDPTIMAWELANEPRPGERDEDNDVVFQTFLGWVESTAGYIHGLDSRHLVTTGSEGYMGCLYDDARVKRLNAAKGIDYMVFHIWPKNWRWFDAARSEATIGDTLRQERDYAARHLAIADALNKPAVVEEFGLDRDGQPALGTPTKCRDRYYAQLFGMIEESAGRGGSAAGSNFWTWGGEGRPPLLGDAPDGVGAGDMPQEPPGLNGVFDCDTSTLKLLASHFAVLRRRADGGGPSL